MKSAPLIVGIVLIIAGAVVLVRGGTFSQRREVLQVGDLKISATEKTPIEPWVAGIAIVAGIALVVTGARRSS